MIDKEKKMEKMHAHIVSQLNVDITFLKNELKSLEGENQDIKNKYLDISKDYNKLQSDYKILEINYNKLKELLAAKEQLLKELTGNTSGLNTSNILNAPNDGKTTTKRSSDSRAGTLREVNDESKVQELEKEVAMYRKLIRDLENKLANASQLNNSSMTEEPSPTKLSFMGVVRKAMGDKNPLVKEAVNKFKSVDTSKNDILPSKTEINDATMYEEVVEVEEEEVVSGKPVKVVKNVVRKKQDSINSNSSFQEKDDKTLVLDDDDDAKIIKPHKPTKTNTKKQAVQNNKAEIEAPNAKVNSQKSSTGKVRKESVEKNQPSQKINQAEKLITTISNNGRTSVSKTPNEESLEENPVAAVNQGKSENSFKSESQPRHNKEKSIDNKTNHNTTSPYAKPNKPVTLKKAQSPQPQTKNQVVKQPQSEKKPVQQDVQTDQKRVNIEVEEAYEMDAENPIIIPDEFPPKTNKQSKQKEIPIPNSKTNQEPRVRESSEGSPEVQNVIRKFRNEPFSKSIPQNKKDLDFKRVITEEDPQDTKTDSPIHDKKPKETRPLPERTPKKIIQYAEEESIALDNQVDELELQEEPIIQNKQDSHEYKIKLSKLRHRSSDPGQITQNVGQAKVLSEPDYQEPETDHDYPYSQLQESEKRDDPREYYNKPRNKSVNSPTPYITSNQNESNFAKESRNTQDYIQKERFINSQKTTSAKTFTPTHSSSTTNLQTPSPLLSPASNYFSKSQSSYKKSEKAAISLSNISHYNAPSAISNNESTKVNPNYYSDIKRKTPVNIGQSSERIVANHYSSPEKDINNSQTTQSNFFGKRYTSFAALPNLSGVNSPTPTMNKMSKTIYTSSRYGFESSQISLPESTLQQSQSEWKNDDISEAIQESPRSYHEASPKMMNIINKQLKREEAGLYPIPKTKEEAETRTMYKSMLYKVQSDPKLMNVFKKVHVERGGHVGEEGEMEIDFNTFQEYHKRLVEEHQSCGPNCIHLQRFYNRIGYYPFWHNRKPLTMKSPLFADVPPPEMPRFKQPMTLPIINGKKTQTPKKE